MPTPQNPGSITSRREIDPRIAFRDLGGVILPLDRLARPGAPRIQDEAN